MAGNSDLPDGFDFLRSEREPACRDCEKPRYTNARVKELLDVAAQNARETLSINSTPIQIRLGRGIYNSKSYSGLPKILSAYREGIVNAEDFTTQVMKIKLRQQELSNEKQLKINNGRFHRFQPTSLPQEPAKCKYVILYNSSYIGAWYIGNETLINGVKKRKVKNRIHDSFPPHTITGINQHTFCQFNGGNVVHMCSADLSNRKRVLICVNSMPSNNYKNGCYRLIPVNEIQSSLPVFQNSCAAIQCCAWNGSQKLIIIGTEGGLYMDKLDTFDVRNFRLPQFSQSNLVALELSDSGHTVYAVNVRGGLVSGDLRSNKISEIADIGFGVEFMKLLKNGNTLITSGHEHKLSNVDIRMGKVVFNYPGFNNRYRKIHFTLDEDWNVLCSTGQDNVTRYWNLRNGEALASLNPPVITADQVHSILTVEENVLSTSIFVGDKIFCYQPL